MSELWFSGPLDLMPWFFLPTFCKKKKNQTNKEKNQQQYHSRATALQKVSVLHSDFCQDVKAIYILKRKIEMVVRMRDVLATPGSVVLACVTLIFF